jgi:hypothetical protein
MLLGQQIQRLILAGTLQDGLDQGGHGAVRRAKWGRAFDSALAGECRMAFSRWNPVLVACITYSRVIPGQHCDSTP